MNHKLIIVKCVPHFKGEWTGTEIPVFDKDVAEDVVIQLSKRLNISPISRHLFALYHPHCKLWLSPNQKIAQWLQEEHNNMFELRVRFKPTDLDALKRDQVAFDYYFFQVRYDFRKKQKSSHSGDQTQRVLGLFIADIVSYVIQSHPDLDEFEAEEKLKEIPIKDFLPLPFAQKIMLMALNADCRNQMKTAWSNSHQDANTPKQEYIRTLLDGLPDTGNSDASAPLWPEYHVEQYSAQVAGRDQQVLIALDFQPLVQEIRVKQKSLTDWETMCSVEELCFIAVKATTKTVEVSRINGIPFNLSFTTESELKSFVSLLDGYYRLSQKWSFSICKDISSPTLTMLKSLKCHGPVGAAFAVRKLKEKAGDKAGTYLLRQSGKNFSDFVVDLYCGRRKMQCMRITKTESGFYCELFDRSYASLSELLSNVILTNDDGAEVKLLSCIPPSENDKSDRLLMCRLKHTVHELTNSHTVSSVPIIYPSSSIINSQTLSDGDRFKVTVGLSCKDSVVVKEVKQERDVVSFLRSANDWIHLKSDCLVAMRGVVMFPPSLVMDYYSLGPLDQFLNKNQSQLKPVDLIESATYCARALWYLEEKKLVHGSIRCHNLLVSAYTPSTLKVKLSDPMSNWRREAPWTAPEERDSPATAAGDVWAFGTTLWEIFCYGKEPPSPDVCDLVQPFGCPTEVWDLIHGCWERFPEERKQPQGIVRDISQILYEVYNSRRTNCYSTLNYTKMQKSAKNKFVRPFFGSLSNLSLRSSIMSTSTLLTGLSSSRSDLISLCSRDPDEVIAPPVNESWLIEANQLSLEAGKILGQGCYGEVVKAVLTKWCGLETEVVAVKRINQNVPIDSGLKDMRREIEIMKKLSHRNIVEIKGFVEDPQLMLVMEYLELGSLVSYLKVHKHRMLQQHGSQLPFKKFALDIVDGMKYLESRKIVHRDLAARNILVASDSEVKISDFGLAQVIKEGDYYRMRTQQCLPLRWYAPESIMRGTFTHKSDVWSFGVTMWEMFSFGKDPVYPECDHDSKLLEKLEEGKRLECPDNCPLEVYEIMRSCWETSSDDRPSFERLEFDIRATNE